MSLSGLEGTRQGEAKREYRLALEALEFTRSLGGDETAGRHRLEQAIANLQVLGMIDYLMAGRYRSWAGLHMAQAQD